MSRFEFGKPVVPAALNLADLPPLRQVEDTVDAMEEGFVPENRPARKPAITDKKSASTIDIDALNALRQRQRELKLLDEQGNLYDPRTQTWASCKLRQEDSVYADLDYFAHYPEMKNGLPANAGKARHSMYEFAFSGMSATSPDKNTQHFFPVSSESITIKFGPRAKLLTLTLCKNTVYFDMLTDLQKNELRKIPNLQLLENDIAILAGGINLADILKRCNIDCNQVKTHIYTRGDESYIPTGKIFVDFNTTATKEMIAEIFQKYEFTFVPGRKKLNFKVSCHPSKNPIQIAYELQQIPHVKLAEPDFYAMVVPAPAKTACM